MKKSVFEKFQAKSLGKEITKSIVGGDYEQCIADCMANSDPYCDYGAYYPGCACSCGKSQYCSMKFGGNTDEFPYCNYW